MERAPKPSLIPDDNEKKISRRNFLKWGAATAGGLAVVGVTEGVRRYMQEDKHPGNIELGPLAEKFVADEQIPNQNQSIVHIAQVHYPFEGGNTKLEDVNQETANLIIEYQKDQETLLLYLKEKYSADIVFNEGFDQGDLDKLSTLKSEIDALRHSTDNVFSLWSSLKLKFDRIRENNDMRTLDAEVAYLFKITWDKEIDLFEQQYANFVAGQQTPPAYQNFFEKMQRANVDGEGMTISLHEWHDEVAAYPQIKGDNVYLAIGAASKLYLEGKLDMRASENEQLSDAVGKAIREQNKTNFQAVQPKREMAAVQLVHDGVKADHKLQQQHFIPLIYGNAHNFSQAVIEQNEQSTISTGLVRIVSKRLIEKYRKKP